MKIHWKTATFVIAMAIILIISFWGIVVYDNTEPGWIGLIIVNIVCITWLFWTIFIIRTMIKYIDKIQQKLVDVKKDIGEIKTLVNTLDSAAKR